MDQQPPRKAPTPASWRPGQSGNVRGRPRRGDALAEVIRSNISPEMLISIAAKLIKADTTPPAVKLDATRFLSDRGYGKAVDRVELNAGQQDDDDEDLSALTTEQLDEIEMLERRRREIIADARDQLAQPKSIAIDLPEVEPR